MSRRVFILGSTGSIGQSSVEIITHLRNRDGEGSWPVIGLAAGTNCRLLKEQAALLKVDSVSVEVATEIGVTNQYKTSVELIQKHAQRGDIIIAAIVGFAGIAPVITAIERGCDIALANKESLVAGGKVVMDAAAYSGVKLLPVDSEHSAIFQALHESPEKEIKKIILTASGGSLRGFSTDKIQNATVNEVLQHPTWNMGKKVTVDSASLMNKTLELIEAHWLFGVEANRLEAIIHPQSIIHGMVEFVDGSVIAQLSPPDMRLPIQYALTWPNRVAGCNTAIDWNTLASLEFENIDVAAFPSIPLAYHVIERGGTAGAILNAANEVVVEAFLQEKLPFGAMVAIVTEVLDRMPINSMQDLNAIIAADEEARVVTKQIVSSYKVNT
ncbi:MAG: 1-deoxy-D-xylulose-5-phosphate reductoisomerase [Planctomycetes bacterium]|nr:1-deoxy-D-xylulose-5-phosphate reductoisomerase [Planctomycetota bacterium]